MKNHSESWLGWDPLVSRIEREATPHCQLSLQLCHYTMMGVEDAGIAQVSVMYTCGGGDGRNQCPAQVPSRASALLAGRPLDPFGQFWEGSRGILSAPCPSHAQ